MLQRFLNNILQIRWLWRNLETVSVNDTNGFTSSLEVDNFLFYINLSIFFQQDQAVTITKYHHWINNTTLNH